MGIDVGGHIDLCARLLLDLRRANGKLLKACKIYVRVLLIAPAEQICRKQREIDSQQRAHCRRTLEVFALHGAKPGSHQQRVKENQRRMVKQAGCARVIQHADASK